MGAEKSKIASALQTYFPQVFECIETMDISALNPLSNKICYDASLAPYSYNQRRYPPIHRAGPIRPQDLPILEELADNINQTDRIYDNLLDDPIRSLLVVALWKEGDLKRIRDLFEGARDVIQGKPYEVDSHSKVWYGLGRHWASGGKEPLLDKHAVRAYLVYRQEFKLVGKRIKSPERADFREYHEWLSAKEFDPDGLFVVHKTLFTLGQAAKTIN